MLGARRLDLVWEFVAAIFEHTHVTSLPMQACPDFSISQATPGYFKEGWLHTVSVVRRVLIFA